MLFCHKEENQDTCFIFHLIHVYPMMIFITVMFVLSILQVLRFDKFIDKYGPPITRYSLYLTLGYIFFVNLGLYVWDNYFV